MDAVIFKDKYVNYDKISDVDLFDINRVLVENDIHIRIGDDFVNDWAGYAYYYCKTHGDLDEEAISSFVYVITWFMCSETIDINPNFKSSKYYKNDKIVSACLRKYVNMVDSYDIESSMDQVIILCDDFFNSVYDFYLKHHMEYVKKTEQISCILSYIDMRLLDDVKGNNRTEKIKNLLCYYYNM